MNGCFRDGASEDFMGINQSQMNIKIQAYKDFILSLSNQSNQIAFNQVSRSQNALLLDLLFITALHQFMDDLKLGPFGNANTFESFKVFKAGSENR